MSGWALTPGPVISGFSLIMLILGIETSCDDTAAAVLDIDVQPATAETAPSPGNCRLPTRVKILASLSQSQDEIHASYGGVVPELASRRHLENILPVVRSTLKEAGLKLEQIDLLAVTQGPGLVGSLLVGLNFVKALSLSAGIPYLGVDHIAGHLASVFLAASPPPSFPHLALTVSGGHSNIFLVDSPTSYTTIGRTRDDAAGEAFDKVAKLLKLGYPGGPEISRRATGGDPESFAFPRAWLGLSLDSKAATLLSGSANFDFSFSGLKTAVVNQIHQRQSLQAQEIADICASFQEAVVEVLVKKTLAAARRFACPQVALSGGVAANLRLRQYLQEAAQADGNLQIFLADPPFCTDNAAMIAMAGFFKRHLATRSMAMDVYSRASAGPGQANKIASAYLP